MRGSRERVWASTWIDRKLASVLALSLEGLEGGLSSNADGSSGCPSTRSLGDGRLRFESFERKRFKRHSEGAGCGSQRCRRRGGDGFHLNSRLCGGNPVFVRERKRAGRSHDSSGEVRRIDRRHDRAAEYSYGVVT